jgi:hypothetical protein
VSDSTFSPPERWEATRDEVLLWRHDRLGYFVGIWVRVDHGSADVCSGSGILHHWSEDSEAAVLERPHARDKLAALYSLHDSVGDEAISLDLSWLPDDGPVAAIRTEDGEGELLVSIAGETVWLSVRAPEPPEAT